MFPKKSESMFTEDKSLQGAVLKMPERAVRPESVRPAPLATAAQAGAPEQARNSVVKASVISAGFEFTGDMKSEGSLTVDGAITGNLTVKALVVGASGKVDGSVTADIITVDGSLSGAVDCKDLTIGARAIVDGKLRYATLTIQRGATIQGELKRV